jgi:hypothetical protein
MLVVADTSPINYLVLLEQTAVLPALYTRVLLPPAVVRELRDAEAPEPVWAWTADLPMWCAVRRPKGRSGLHQNSLLDPTFLSSIRTVTYPHP